MKIIPEVTHNILPRSFSYGDKHHLVVTTILYMDIVSQEILRLSKLWDETGEFLREGQPLEDFFPKSNGEVIIYGNCYSKKPVTVKEVGFKLRGEDFELKKELSVIGNRVLTKNLIGKIAISEPKEFTKMNK